jgi:hypothetical protein
MHQPGMDRSTDATLQAAREWWAEHWEDDDQGHGEQP